MLSFSAAPPEFCESDRARGRGLTSDEHFTVDGTLLEAWASVKSFQPKAKKKTPSPDDPGNPTVNFHGEKRSNDTHKSTTDPESQLACKGGGKEAKLSYSGHLLLENLNGLIVDAEGFQANGTAERDAALLMLERVPGTKAVTVGGDKGFDTRGFVAECRDLRVTPHVAQNHARAGGSAIDARTTRHAGYKISQRLLERQGQKEQSRIDVAEGISQTLEAGSAAARVERPRRQETRAQVPHASQHFCRRVAEEECQPRPRGRATGTIRKRCGNTTSSGCPSCSAS